MDKRYESKYTKKWTMSKNSPHSLPMRAMLLSLCKSGQPPTITNIH